MIKFLHFITILSMVMIGNTLYSQSTGLYYTSEQADFSYPVTDFNVNAVTKHNRTVYLGGTFSYIGPNTGYGICMDSSANLIPGGFPRVEGKINVAIPDGSGGIYIGGDFTRANNQFINGIAHVDASGKLLNDLPPVEGAVSCMVLKNDVLYIGGRISSIGGIAQTYIAGINIKTGKLTSFNFPGINGDVNTICISGNLMYIGGVFSKSYFIIKYDLTTDKTAYWNLAPNKSITKIVCQKGKIYVAGDFTLIAGKPRYGLASFDSITEALTSFNPALLANSAINDMVVSGNRIYINGTFTPVGGSIQTTIGFIDQSTNKCTPLTPFDNVQELGFIRLFKDKLMIHGRFKTGEEYRRRLVLLDMTTNTVEPFRDLKINSPVTYYIESKDNIFIGGHFNSFGGEYRQGFAAFDVHTKKISAMKLKPLKTVQDFLVSNELLYIATTDTILAVDSVGNTSFVLSVPGSCKKMKSYKGHIYLSGYFQSVNGLPRKRLASIDETTKQVDPWNPSALGSVTDFEIVDTIMYVVGQFDSIGKLPRHHIAAISLHSGMATPWDAKVKSTTITNIEASTTQLFISGDFDTVGTIYRPRLAGIDPATGKVTHWRPYIEPAYVAYDIKIKDNILYVQSYGQGKTFRGLGALDANTGQFIKWLYTPWLNYIHYADFSSPVYSHTNFFFLIDDLVYGCGSNDYFFKQTVSGFFVVPKARLFSHYVSGTVYYDSILNCSKQPFERGLRSIIVQSQPANSYVCTDSMGLYRMGLHDSVTYAIKPIIPRSLQPIYGLPCPNNYHVTMTAQSPFDSIGFDFGHAKNTCPLLRVNISDTRRRRCLRSQTFVTYSNDGVVNASNVAVHVKFPDYTIPISASHPYTWDPVDSSLIFMIGNVATGQSGSITITDSVSCKNGIYGLIQCVKAWITPPNDCYNALDPTLPNWDHSSVEVTGKCLAGKGIVRFKIQNTGTGDMQTAKQYRLYADNLIQSMSTYQLKKNDSLIIEHLAAGATLRLETDQTPGYPGNKHPYFAIEACRALVTDPYSTGYMDSRPLNDDNTEIEIHCSAIVDSFDPNLKDVCPKGAGALHVVDPATLLNYHIDFQNTGTDTAYKVMVVDSLSPDLDVSTLELGVSSYPYVFSVSGTDNPVLQFTMDGINLTDSASDELHSHGFIEFKIAPKTTTAIGTRINNSADIFFDFNFPVRTNTAWVTVDTTILNKEYVVNVISQPAIKSTVCKGDSVWIHTAFASKGVKKYEWYKDDQLLSGQTDSVLIIPSLNVSDRGYYYCKATGYINTVSTNKIYLDCKPLPHPLVKIQNDSLYSVNSYNAYQWLLNNTIIPGAINRYYYHPLIGKYTLQVTDSNQCYGISAPVLVTSVETAADEHIQLLPNPAGESVSVETTGTPLTRICVYSINGMLLKDIYPNGNLKNQIQLTMLSKGIYFVECHKEGSIYRYKLVKQ